MGLGDTQDCVQVATRPLIKFKTMKRKPLSMKKLYQYVADFLVEEQELERKQNEFMGFDVSKEHLIFHTKERNSVLVRYLDYIWKNPK